MAVSSGESQRPPRASHEQLTALDATFLELEQNDDGSHMHIGAAFVFDPVEPDRDAEGDDERARIPTVETVRHRLTSRLGALPRYRQRLSAPRVGGLAYPTWVQDERFDIAAHVRHATLPAPGRDDELLDWISDYFSHRLDRRRPLWEVVLLDGLADGRWALVWKAHHCLVDGVGSVDVAELMIDGVWESAPVDPDEPHSGGVLDRAPEALRQAAQAGLSAGRSALHGIRHPVGAAESSASLLELLLRNGVAAPSCSLSGPLGATRRIATVHFALEDVRSIRASLGGTVNDVLLAAATAGVRALLLARGEEPPERGLRAMVPVNRRREEQHRDLGNRVASMFLSLPVAEPESLRRYEQIVATTSAAKRGGGSAGTEALLALAELAPPVLHAGIVSRLDPARLYNLTITNVPGPAVTMHAFGAPVTDIIPIVPLPAGQTVGIAIVSYAGGVTVGLCADRAAVPDLEVLADAAFAELVGLDAAAVAARIA
jgi:WS/DGAT/MGAT family acyltransferase